MPPERVAVFKRGHQIGHLAQQLFPNGADLTPKSPSQYKKTVLKTKELVCSESVQTIYEAGFQADKTLILLDILVKADDGWEAYEVKSSLTLSETYYKDAALQNYIIRKSGLELKRFFLIHMNPDYILQDNLDLNKLFVKVDVTKQVNEQMDAIAENIQESLKTTTLTSSPEITIGQHCFSPYDCDFIGHCWKKERKPGFFNLPNLNLTEKQRLFNEFNGVLNAALTSENADPIVKQQIHAWITQEPYLNKQKIKEWIQQWDKWSIVKPLYFKSALPLFKGDKPYQKHLFAYGILRLVQSETGNLNPRYEIQIADTDELSILKFQASFDKLIAEHQTIMYENDEGNGIIDVFRQGWYVHPLVYDSYQLHDVVKIWNPNWKTLWDCPSDPIASQKFLEVLTNEDLEPENIALIENYLRGELHLMAELLQHLSKC